MTSMRTSVPVLAAGLILAMTAPAAVLAQAHNHDSETPTAAETDGVAKRFVCQDGGAILTRFSTEHGHLVAIVDTFDGDGRTPWRRARRNWRPSS